MMFIFSFYKLLKKGKELGDVGMEATCKLQEYNKKGHFLSTGLLYFILFYV